MRFRFRSSKRDESVDASRVGSVEKSIRSALADIEAEKKGLQRRLQEARNQASMLVGSEPFEYRDREEAKEEKLSASEHNLITAAGRLRELDTQTEHLQRVLQALKQK
jgi:chromosome segregation ATPase